MAFGVAPFGSRSFDEMLDRRLKARRELDTVLRADPLSPGYELPPEEPAPAAAAPRKGRGPALSAALRAGSAKKGFFPGLLEGFTAADEADRAYQAAEAAKAQERADRERQFGLEERRVAADELRAGREPVARTPGETTAQELAATMEFLQKAGATPAEIKTFFLTKGRSSSGDLSDLDNLARSYVETGRAKTLAEGYILARRESATPQPVGFIRRTIYDPKSLNFTTVNASVYRRFNPLTGTFETLDQWGNVLTPEDQAQIQSNPNAFAGGSGGPAIPFGGAAPTPETEADVPPVFRSILNPQTGFNLPPGALPGGGAFPPRSAAPAPPAGNRPSWLNYVKPGP